MKIGILISGNGSNMIKLIESCEKNNNSSIGLVVSNNPEAKGIEYANWKKIKTIIVNHKNFKEREEFDNKINDVLL